MSDGFTDKNIIIDNHTYFDSLAAPNPAEYPQLLKLIKGGRLPKVAERKQWKTKFGLDTHEFKSLQEHEIRTQGSSNVSGSQGTGERWKCFKYLKHVFASFRSGRKF